MGAAMQASDVLKFLPYMHVLSLEVCIVHDYSITYKDFDIMVQN